MSLRSFSARLRVSTFIVGVGLYGVLAGSAAYAAGNAVQTYTDQVLPVPPPAIDDRFDSPLSAGTLTLQDVLEAHKNVQPSPLPPISGMPVTPSATAPLLQPPAQSSSTSLMMSQGMKDVLQKVGGVNVAPVQARGAKPVATEAPQAIVTSTAAPVSTTASGVQYQPGQAPKNLANGQVIADVAGANATSTVATTATSDSPSCGQDVDKWEKSCGDAGYPANYVGKIVGETRKGCADGTLHDVWITNSCAPPDSSNDTTTKTNGACGMASDNEFDAAPPSNLCAQGIASTVKGANGGTDGPWTWACSGINGGDAAACVAQKREPMTNGVCGDANGVAGSSAPMSDLCSVGTATQMKGTGPWTWSCRGHGKGGTQSCIAPVAAVVAKSSDVEAAPVVQEVPVAAPAVLPVASEKPVAASAVSGSNAADSDKGELCGSAAETLASSAPDKDLCRVGSASVVNGDGPWSWSCTDNEGTTSNCRTLSLSGDGSAVPVATATPAAAPSQPVQSVLAVSPAHRAALMASDSDSGALACGVAASRPMSSQPASGLCEGGKASKVHGSGPWHWTCSDNSHHKVSCATTQSVDGACGAANGTSLKSAPFSGLCSRGTPSSIDGNGPWTWVCNGSGSGANVNCAASVQGKQSASVTAVDGVCGSSDNTNVSSAPGDGLCNSGIASDVSGTGPWTWSCSGSNGGNVASCVATKIAATRPPGVKVNGLCGVANGVISDTQPTAELCATGRSSGIVGNGPWNWSCVGENGGMTVSCTAPLTPPAPIDGECGGADGVPTLVKPQSGLCSAGITGAVNGKGPWTWSCSGANGGNPASCVAPVAGKSGAMPSTMVTASDSDMAAAPVSTPSGLVTPQLAGDQTLPALDTKTLPSLTKSRAATNALKTPALANVTGNNAPDAAPSLPDDMQPVTPPSRNISSAPALQEQTPDVPSHVAGNHLTLDPTISTVLFDRGSSNIAANVVSTLERLSAVLVANPDVRIALTAYADNDGSTPRDARRLSLTRALAVRDYLTSKGIAESRIDVHAEGSNTTSGYIDRVDVKVVN